MRPANITIQRAVPEIPCVRFEISSPLILNVGRMNTRGLVPPVDATPFEDVRRDIK
jgi:hypothetical protein